MIPHGIPDSINVEIYFSIMKLPFTFPKILNTKSKPREYILSLSLNSDHVAGACWYVEGKPTPVLLNAVARRLNKDSWDERIQAADDIITALEEKVGTEDIHKVIFGMPAQYLTDSGDISHSIRPELKKLTTQLDLKPIGFVPVHQAIIYKLKQDEGIPPTVLLVGVSKDILTITLYKIGTFISQQVVQSSDPVAPQIEKAFSTFTNVEVLPSRILLYGANSAKLESLKNELINYPWTSKSNFLHFPKISILPADTTVFSISLAGASELGKMLIHDEPTTDKNDTFHATAVENQPQEKEEKIDETIEAESAEEEVISDEETTDVTLGEKIDKESKGEISEPIETEVTDEVNETVDIGEESNIEVVSPEEIGFTTPKVHHSQEEMKEEKSKVYPTHEISGSIPTKIPDTSEDTEEDEPKFSLSPLLDILNTKVLPVMTTITKGSLSKKLLIFVPLALGILGLCYYLLFIVTPRANISLILQTKPIQQSVALTIDPNETTIDFSKNILPGHKEEKTLSGDKTITVTGKKKVGDPAKGTVTIYNKSLSELNLKKGHQIVSGSLKFTLDTDVKIASAAESIGSITFGKGDVAVTAMQIGEASNLTSGTEFSLKDLSSNTAIARNGEAFTGGTSRDVTVVTYDDYSVLTNALVKDLTERAKQELVSSGSGKLKMIDGTIKVADTKKQFKEELGEETNELHGTITVTLNGIAYDQEELKNYFSQSIKKDLPTGYEIESNKTQVSLGKVQVKKDGTIIGEGAITTTAIPQVDMMDVAQSIAGKSVDEAKNDMKKMNGVTDVQILISSFVNKNMLPVRKENIKVTITTKEK